MFASLPTLLMIKGEYIKHIAASTGTRVLLKGMGYSGPEPLHLQIIGENSAGLEKAKSLSQSLLDTIQTQYDTFMYEYHFTTSNLTGNPKLTYLRNHHKPMLCLELIQVLR